MRTARSNAASFTRLGNQWVHQTVEGERREKALAATGVAVWPMTDLEADDGLASAAHIASGNEDVEKVCITSQLDRDTPRCHLGVRGKHRITAIGRLANI